MKRVVYTVGYFFKEGKKNMPCLWVWLALNAVLHGIQLYVAAEYSGKLVDHLIGRDMGYFL